MGWEMCLITAQGVIPEEHRSHTAAVLEEVLWAIAQRDRLKG